MKRLIDTTIGTGAYEYLSEFIDFQSEVDIISSINPSDISKLSGPGAVINLSKTNNIRYINKFFETVNAQLRDGDLYAGCVETFTARRNRKLINNVPVIGKLYFGMEFIFLRVFPKVSGLKKLYFAASKGRNRLLSKAETLGRLVSCGFEIQGMKTFNGLLYFVVKKVKEPVYDMSPSYGLLYKMPRVGKNNKIIGVYKFRTMHPYAEYLHGYVLQQNGYSLSGKPADDFRLTPWGKFMRRYWIDELPQILNVLKGDLKLVGIRPVSSRYFEDIPEDLRMLRITQKPGCVPPYVAMNASSDVQSVLEAERMYLIEKLRDPYTTDLRFFCNAMWNIVVRRKRSA